MLKVDRFLEKHNVKLNEEQKKAVAQVSGPVLLSAVPGSGKTTTLVSRIGYMIGVEKIAPSSIIAISYTNASTNDMRERFESFFPGMGNPGMFRTIHSLCNLIYTYHTESLGMPKPVIEPNTDALVRTAFSDAYGEYAEESDIMEAKRQITYAKNMLLSEKQMTRIRVCDHSLKPLYIAYEKVLNKAGVIDFDDLLIRAYECLCDSPDTLSHFQGIYRYFLLDEAQDASKLQHMILRLLASKTKNVFMVGDEDQSIYAFRAAYPQAMASFEKDYKGAKVLFLKNNYRSTPQIVEAANEFIRLNKERRDVSMNAIHQDGPDIRFLEAGIRAEQYDRLCSTIRAFAPVSAAVLFRNNDSAVPLIYALEQNGIPYRSRGIDTSFFSCSVIRDIKAMLDYAQEPLNKDLFLNVYYRFGAKISRRDAQDAIEQLNHRLDSSYFDSLYRIFRRKKRKTDDLIRILEYLPQIRDMFPVYTLQVLDVIEKKLRPTTPSEHDKFDILRAISKKDDTIWVLLHRLKSLEKSVASGGGRKGRNSTLTLSTIHASKGLEFDSVFLIDVIKGIFPVNEDITDPNIEEERRLFYVAITRAKTNLTVCLYKNSSSFAQKLAQIVDRNSARGVNLFSSTVSVQPAAKPIIQYNEELDESDLTQGKRVRHVKEGLGEVVARDGDVVHIRFANNETKKYIISLCVENGFLKRA